jgi:hypothetical protein
MIGKPDSGKLNVRFDEGELEIGPQPLRQLPTLPGIRGIICFIKQSLREIDPDAVVRGD